MQRALQVLGSCGLPITVLRTEYPGRDLSIVDVLNAGCSKGHALERWANYRQITREQVMAIGDNYNDIEMLAFAGHPFIMGNASEELRGPGLEADPLERRKRRIRGHRARAEWKSAERGCGGRDWRRGDCGVNES